MADVTFGEAKIRAVGDLMRSDERVVVIGGALFGGLLHQKFVQPLFDEFDARILRTPISELHWNWSAAIGRLWSASNEPFHSTRTWPRPITTTPSC